MFSFRPGPEGSSCSRGGCHLHCTNEHLNLVLLAQQPGVGEVGWRLSLGREQDFGNQLPQVMAKADAALGTW